MGTELADRAQLAEVITPAPRAPWSAIVAGDPLAMADHVPEWTDAITVTGRYSDASRLYHFTDGRRFVVPLLRRTGPTGAGGWLLSPPPAWGFGGVVGADQDRLVVEAIFADLRGLGAQRVWIRPDPLRARLWAGVDAPGLLRISRAAHVVDLTSVDDPDECFSKSTRKAIRRALNRGVTVESDATGESIRMHYDMFLDSVDRWARRSREPRHLARWRAQRRDRVEKLQAMARLLGPGRFVQHVAYHEGRPVASAIVLLGAAAHDTRAASFQHLAGPLQANDLLTAHAIRHAAEAGARHYHLGETGTSASLAQFKEKFGAVRHPYDELRLERLPFTRLDSAARGAVKRAIGFRD